MTELILVGGILVILAFLAYQQRKVNEKIDSLYDFTTQNLLVHEREIMDLTYRVNSVIVAHTNHLQEYYHLDDNLKIVKPPIPLNEEFAVAALQVKIKSLGKQLGYIKSDS